MSIRYLAQEATQFIYEYDLSIHSQFVYTMTTKKNSIKYTDDDDFIIRLLTNKKELKENNIAMSSIEVGSIIHQNDSWAIYLECKSPKEIRLVGRRNSVEEEERKQYHAEERMAIIGERGNLLAIV